jgi:hypothetical protein
MSKKLPLRLTAVAFAAALTLAGTAEAGSFSAGPGSRGTAEIAPLSAAWGWLSGLWQDVTGSLLQLSASTAEPPAPTGEQGQCTNCAESDAGWVIDPNGGG